jgi:hypothetical protein
MPSTLILYLRILSASGVAHLRMARRPPPGVDEGVGRALSTIGRWARRCAGIGGFVLWRARASRLRSRVKHLRGLQSMPHSPEERALWSAFALSARSARKWCIAVTSSGSSGSPQQHRRAVVLRKQIVYHAAPRRLRCSPGCQLGSGAVWQARACDDPPQERA